MSDYLFVLDSQQGSKLFYPYLMLLNLNQCRGRVRVFNNCNFIMIRDDSRSLDRLPLNFYAIFICFFSAKRFPTPI